MERSDRAEWPSRTRTCPDGGQRVVCAAPALAVKEIACGVAAPPQPARRCRCRYRLLAGVGAWRTAWLGGIGKRLAEVFARSRLERIHD